MDLRYQPPPTVEKFMLDDEHIFRAIVGPIGSGKSMGCIMELLRRASTQIPNNGVRYTRFALIRNTLQQLRQTVLTDIQAYLGPIVHYYVTDSTVQLRGPLPDGTQLHSDWIMIPLDTKEDVRRLLSTQLTGAWINELREVPIEVVSGVLGRLGRYPSRLMGGPSWFGLISDSNPWDTDSPYHEAFVLNPSKGWQLYLQPSGLSPQAENVENLPPGYYETLSGDRDEGWVQVHVESQWGTSNAGQAVFRRSFHAPTHVREIRAVVNPHKPLMVGLDFGRTPCALITQVDTQGRLIIYKEIVTEGMGLLQMIQEHLKPALLGSPFDVNRVFIVGDPAGAQKSQITEETAFDTLRQEGFLAYPAATNSIEPRLLAVERLFRTTLMGEPAIQISREGCPTLIQALGNRYRYRRKRDGQFEDIPEKLHPWSDVCFTSGSMVGVPGGLKAIEYLKVGDFVNIGHITRRSGTGRVEARGSRTVDLTVEITLADRRTLRCTPEHPFYVDGKWRPAYTLHHGDILESVKWGYQEPTGKNFLTFATTMVKAGITATKAKVSTAWCGSTITALFHRGISSITAMVTRQTMPSTIWSFSPDINTANTTLPPAMSRLLARTLVPAPQNGTAAPRGVRGTGNTVSGPGTPPFWKAISARVAARFTKPVTAAVSAGSARWLASLRRAGAAAWITKHAPASSAVKYFLSINTVRLNHAPEVAEVKWLHESVIVYNLRIDTGVYYVNGIITSNCDALQYAALGTQSNYTARVLRRERAYTSGEPVSARGWT